MLRILHYKCTMTPVSGVLQALLVSMGAVSGMVFYRETERMEPGDTVAVLGSILVICVGTFCCVLSQPNIEQCTQTEKAKLINGAEGGWSRISAQPAA